MNAAVYARKSNASDVDADLKSTARQIVAARTFAESKGRHVVRVFEDDAVSGAIPNRPAGKLVTSVENFCAEVFREGIRTKTRNALVQRVKSGRVAGGRVLGYRNVTQGSATVREVDPDQARVVRRIFELAASGKGFLKIAATLNGEPPSRDPPQSTSDRSQGLLGAGRQSRPGARTTSAEGGSALV